MSEGHDAGSFVVRRVRADELDAAGVLTLAVYEEFMVGRDDPYRDRLRNAEVRDREAEVWVAVDDEPGDLLGTVTLCPAGSPWRELARPGEGEFRMLAVDPRARRRGVGRALVDLAADRARADGESRMVLSSLAAMTDAHRLYERLGFVRSPERDWSPVPDVSLIAYTQEL